MSLYTGHRCDVWKGTANIQNTGAVFTGTYMKIYTNIDCRYHELDSTDKIQAGAIDISKSMREVFFNGLIINDLRIFYILHFYDDNTLWLINSPVLHSTAVKNYYCAMIELLRAGPKEVISFV